jgi:Zn-dependent peptidase ImmA (M78 family)
MIDIKRAEKKMREFQGIMRLQDWDIELILCGKDKMNTISDNPNNRGYSVRNRMYKHAFIYYNTESTDNEGKFDEVIVHELLHVLEDEYDFFIDQFVPEDRESEHNIRHERFIIELTRAFMNALIQ